MDGCNHIWVERKDGYEEQCTAAICLVCGEYGCVSKLRLDLIPKKLHQRRMQLFTELGVNGNEHEIENSLATESTRHGIADRRSRTEVTES